MECYQQLDVLSVDDVVILSHGIYNACGIFSSFPSNELRICKLASDQMKDESFIALLSLPQEVAGQSLEA